jgi:hypothetical protein
MRPLPSTTTNASSRAQHHDPDALAQASRAAPLDCFITTESCLLDDHFNQDGADIPSNPQIQPEKQPIIREMPTSEGPKLLPRLFQTGSSAASPNVEQHRSRPPSPGSVFTGIYGPGSVNSIPSSPGGLSSVTMSEDPHSLSASFLELPPSHSPGPGILAGLPRAITPQLVMPSLTIPQRRPFSEIGRSLGKLKVLVTGPRGRSLLPMAGHNTESLILGVGIGKTSLIFAIAQSSTHIVHMDSINNVSSGTATDVYASTRPKPWWSTDLDRNILKRRRSSTPDEVLDRNICFVDCPAYGENVQVKLSNPIPL